MSAYKCINRMKQWAAENGVEGPVDDHLNDIMCEVVGDVINALGVHTIVSVIPEDYDAATSRCGDDITLANIAWWWLWDHLFTGEYNGAETGIRNQTPGTNS